MVKNVVVVAVVTCKHSFCLLGFYFSILVNVLEVFRVSDVRELLKCSALLKIRLVAVYTGVELRSISTCCNHI